MNYYNCTIYCIFYSPKIKMNVISKFIIIFMNSTPPQLQAPKQVQHYQLVNILYKTPIAQFWKASHKILKKKFVVKKMKIDQEAFQKNGIDLRMDKIFEIAKYESRLLESIKNESAPKCLKLIRSTTTSYIVYDDFSGQSLSSFLLQQTPSDQDISTIMIEMTKKINQFHKEGITFLALTFQSVFISNLKKIMFTDTTLINKKAESCPCQQTLISFLKIRQEKTLPDFKRHQAIDVYCLGSIFLKMMENHPTFSIKMKRVISKMRSSRQECIPNLTNILEQLQIINGELKIDSCDTPKFKRYNQRKEDQTNFNGCFKLSLKRIKSQETILKKDEIPIRGTTARHLQKMEQSKSTLANSLSLRDKFFISKTHLIGKVILRKRNFGSFLIYISLQVMNIDPFLSFLLLKKAKSTLLLIQSQCQQIKQQYNTLHSKIWSIVQAESSKLEVLMLKMQQLLVQLHLADAKNNNFQSTRCLVCEKHLRDIIIKSITGTVLSTKYTHHSFQKVSAIYFQLYILSNYIREGSFQQFWEKVFKADQQHDVDRFFQEERKLGLRYFKKKIQETIEKIK